jgi:hypothetical protein
LHFRRKNIHHHLTGCLFRKIFIKSYSHTVYKFKMANANSFYVVN